MNINKEGIEISNRFFQVINILQMRGEIRGLQTYTRLYGINRWNLLSVRENPQARVLKPEILAPLVKDFGVSAEWLLTGNGGVFKY